MPTYNLPPFRESDGVTFLNIVNPIITPDPDTILLKTSLSMIDVDILIELPYGSKMGYRLKDIPTQNMNYEGYENLHQTVMVRMADFEVMEEE